MYKEWFMNTIYFIRLPFRLADCIPDKTLEVSFNDILEKIPNEMYSVPLVNLD